MKHLHTFARSFILSKDHFYTLLVDALTLAIVVFLFLWFGNLLNAQAAAVSNGQTLQQLQESLQSASPEAAEAFLASLQSFTLLLIIGSLLLLLITLLISSTSRALVWNRLQHTHLSGKRYWRWNGLLLAVALLFAPYFVAITFIKMSLDAFITFSRPMIAQLYSQLYTSFFILLFIIFSFLVFHFFVSKYKVWESVSEAFHSIKARWASFWRMFVLVFLTGIAFSVIFSYLRYLLRFSAPWISTALSLLVFLLFLSWARIYLVRTISHGP